MFSGIEELETAFKSSGDRINEVTTSIVTINNTPALRADSPPYRTTYYAAS